MRFARLPLTRRWILAIILTAVGTSSADVFSELPGTDTYAVGGSAIEYGSLAPLVTESGRISLSIDGSVKFTGNVSSTSYKWNTKSAKAGTHTISQRGPGSSSNRPSLAVQHHAIGGCFVCFGDLSSACLLIDAGPLGLRRH